MAIERDGGCKRGRALKAQNRPHAARCRPGGALAAGSTGAKFDKPAIIDASKIGGAWAHSLRWICDSASRILRNCIFILTYYTFSFGQRGPRWDALRTFLEVAHEPQRRGAPLVAVEVLSPIFRFSRPQPRHRRRTRVHQPQRGSLPRRRRHCGAHGPRDPERARCAPDRDYAHSALWRRRFRSRPRSLAKNPPRRGRRRVNCRWLRGSAAIVVTPIFPATL